MRIVFATFLLFALFACKESRHPRLAQYNLVQDTLVIDGPCIVTNTKFIRKNFGFADNSAELDSLREVVKFLTRFALKDSILVLDTQYSLIKTTDYFGEFPAATINLEQYEKPIAFYIPGRELIVIEEWASKDVLIYALEGNTSAVKKELAKLDSIRNTISGEENALAQDAEKLERIRIEAEANKQLKEMQPKSTQDRVDIGKN